MSKKFHLGNIVVCSNPVKIFHCINSKEILDYNIVRCQTSPSKLWEDILKNLDISFTEPSGCIFVSIYKLLIGQLLMISIFMRRQQLCLIKHRVEKVLDPNTICHHQPMSIQETLNRYLTCNRPIFVITSLSYLSMCKNPIVSIIDNKL